MLQEQHSNKKNVAEILLVEDNPQDAMLTLKAFKALKIAYNITVAKDGEQALAILNQEGMYSMSSPPALILLDLGLPKMAGIDILKHVKSKKELRDIPVLVLTGSSDTQNVVESYDLKAHSYIMKPVDLAKQHIIEDLLNIRGYK